MPRHDSPVPRHVMSGFVICSCALCRDRSPPGMFSSPAPSMRTNLLVFLLVLRYVFLLSCCDLLFYVLLYGVFCCPFSVGAA